MDRSYLVGALVGGIVALALVGGWMVLAPGLRTPEPPPAVAPPPPPPEPEPLVTAQEYDALKLNMPYLQVTQIIGDLEDDRYTEDRPGGEYTQPTVIEWCTWRNPDGSSITLGFDLDRLIEKNVNGVLPEAAP